MVRLAAADPAAVARAVRVRPLAVILALLVAAPLFGLLGMVLAAPVVAAVKILAGHWWASRTLRTDQQLGAASGALACLERRSTPEVNPVPATQEPA